MRKLIGNYHCGVRSVKLYVDTSIDGAQFFTHAGVIEVGIDVGKPWSQMVNHLLHEAFEMACSDMGKRWQNAPDYSHSAEGWLFVLTHFEMAEIIARVAHFTAAALPDLANAYNEFCDKQKKKKG